MSSNSYYLKIAIMLIATGAGIFAIWYVLVREESSDWVVGQIVHQASPYVITETEDGLLINNALMGYSFALPKGFKTTGAKNLSFFLEADGIKKCEIKHSAVNKSRQPIAGNGKTVVSAGEVKLIFELVNKNEIDDCGEYLEEIINSISN